MSETTAIRRSTIEAKRLDAAASGAECRLLDTIAMGEGMAGGVLENLDQVLDRSERGTSMDL